MVGVATPRFDGMAVALLAVRSTAEEFTADVELTPGLPHWNAGLSRVDEPMLVWWAADDRGGHYLGQPAGWHSAPDRAWRPGRVLAGAGPRGHPAGHHADHADPAGGHPGPAELGGDPVTRPWWAGLPAAEASLDCGGKPHRLRWADGQLHPLDHTDDLAGEQILSALGGHRIRCLDVLETWAQHETDLRVLILASRGPADPLASWVPPPSGPGWTGRPGRPAARAAGPATPCCPTARRTTRTKACAR